jgi:DNA helicase-2/ATP-dependent DNA helicase PcrA
MTSRLLTKAQIDGALGFTLTDEQWQAVSASLDPAVIVAGAGSGKTTSMAARVAWLVGSDLVRPDAVLGLTFTTKATAQLMASMRSSLAALAADGLLSDLDPDGDTVGEPAVLTYHAFSARIVAEHGIRLGREPGSGVLTAGARHQLAFRLVCRSSLPLAGFGRSPVDITSDLLSLDDELAELGISPSHLRSFDDDMAAMLRSFEPLQNIGQDMVAASLQRSVLADLVEHWRGEKAARDVLDFADQIRLASEIVQRYPDVVDDLRARHAVVLLDEYQDTSIAQRVLLQTIFGDGHPVMAVGDPCQAIYGWRGASVDNIENFPRHFPPASRSAARAASRFVLSQNRRSGPQILEVANRTSAHLRSVHTGVEPLRSADNGKGAGRVACAVFDTYSQEIAWLVQQVQGTHAGGGPWSQIAVLAATGRDLVAVDAALRRAGVPTQLVGAAALLAQPAVIDLRAMLEVIHDPTATPSFIRLAAAPRWRTGPRDLAALGHRAAGLAGGRQRSDEPGIDAALDDAVAGSDIVEAVSLTEALDDLGDPTAYSSEARDRFALMAAEMGRLRSHVGEPVADLVLRVMRTTGLEVEAALGQPEIATAQQHALAAFGDLAADFTDLDGRMSLGAFLGRLRDAERFDVDLELDLGGPADAVQLLTVHKAKGLEFGHVFVPFVSKGAFPGGRGRPSWPTSAKSVPWPLRDDCTDELASFPVLGEGPRAKHYTEYKKVLADLTTLENQRLAYVAFTRAERSLTVSGHWWGPTQAKPRGPDPFLLGVYEACRDGAGEVVHWADAPGDDVSNPEATASSLPMPWPADPSPVRLAALEQAARAVRDVTDMQQVLPGTAGESARKGAVAGVDLARLEHWDLLASALVDEAREQRAVDRVVRLPDAVSASLLMRALADPGAVARDLARPMPHPPAPAGAAPSSMPGSRPASGSSPCSTRRPTGRGGRRHRI